MTRSPALVAGLLLLWGLTPAARVSAQAKSVDFLTAVPETPAFTYLGLTPAKVQRPGNLRDLGAAVLGGVGEDGRAQQGFALDASVWNLIPGFDLPLEKYRGNPFHYALGNLQVSVATSRAAGDSSDLIASLGFKTVLLDRADPLRDQAILDLLAAGLATCAPAQPG